MSRRAALLSAMAGLALPRRALAGDNGPTGRLVPVRDTRLWVETYGDPRAPALLYIHGGPGLGVFEFSHYLRSRLSQNFYLVLADQRGVLRSDGWSGTPAMSLDLLVEDYEALRAALGIEHWIVLGHSWGGPVALRYATSRLSVRAVVFENPVLDAQSTGRNMLRHAAAMLEEVGRRQDATALRRLSTADVLAMWSDMDEALNRLPNRQSLYVHDRSFLGFYGRISADSGLSDHAWGQGRRMAEALLCNPAVLAPAWNRMSGLTQPCLLLRGAADPSTSPEEMSVMQAKRNVEVANIPGSGHFMHVEQPAAFSDAVDAWAGRAGLL